MTTLVALQAQLADLKAARATGALEVEFNGRRVRYRSDRELVSAIAAIEAEIAGTSQTRIVTIRSTKGF
jgi:hypothetical protein